MNSWTSIAECRPRLVGLMIRRLGNHADAEDAVQEGMIRAILNADRFKTDQDLFIWLRTIVVNVGRDMMRSRRRHDVTSLQEWDQAGDVNPADLLERREHSAIISQCLDRLSDRDRLMLQMFHDRQMNYRAMAAELGISAYKVKSRLFSARQRFRNLYAAGS